MQKRHHQRKRQKRPEAGSERTLRLDRGDSTVTTRDKKNRIRELTALLSEASRAYYAEGREIMPNIEYDALYDELSALEKETGIILSGSPTQTVGYEVLSELPKERHQSPMLSLDKTKSVEELGAWLSGKKGILSWKLDGLTIVLTYRDGELRKAVTRGNGEIGEVVTPNARFFEGLPLKISFKGELVIRGEAIIRYSDFARINEELPEADAAYKNPRNLCSGSVRQLDPSITRQRHVNLIVFQLVKAENIDFNNSFKAQFEWLREQGFDVVEYKEVDEGSIAAAVEDFKERVRDYDLPSDGLVLTFEDIAYGLSLGRTAKFPKNSIAFKWQDETAETVLRYVEWSSSRTGLINPIAVFDPVELEGTTVTRASVHNLSIVKELGLGIGDHIRVYKANMIIPQIAEDITRSGNIEIPKTCPVCGGATVVRKDKDAKTLYCTNPDCPAKKIKAFTLMVSRDALNIDGLSEMKLEKFIQAGFIKEFADLFELGAHKEEIVSMEGFGEKSYDNLISAVERARETELYRPLYGLGIPGIGLSGAKLITRHFGADYERIRSADKEELLSIDGIGEVLADSFAGYFADAKKCAEADRLMERLIIRTDEPGDMTKELETDIDGDKLRIRRDRFAGLTFVITGDVEHFKNRRELQDLIESLGGKASGSVSKKTSYLINNDSLSQSSKNKKARELSVPVITEAEFIELLKE